MVFILKKLTIQWGRQESDWNIITKACRGLFGVLRKGPKLSMVVKAASLKGSYLSQVLKEPGNYRTGGHWCPRRKVSSSQWGQREGVGRYTNGSVEGTDGEENSVWFLVTA